MEEFTSKSNPFQDPNLDKVFVWKRKAQKLGWDKDRAKLEAQQTRERNLVDIEVAKRRRVERDQELLTRQEERDRQDRLRDSQAHSDWEAREEEFMLKQHKQAAAIRINQGRETVSDSLARNVLLMRELQFGPELGADGKETFALALEVGANVQSPLELITKQNASEVQLQLARYLELETVNEFKAYWTALLGCCQDLLWETTHVPAVVRDSIREYCELKTLDQVARERADALQRQHDPGQAGEQVFYGELERVWRAEEHRKRACELASGMVAQLQAKGRGAHRVPMWAELQLQNERRARSLENQEDDDLGDNIETLFLECCFVGQPELGKQIKPRFWNRVKLGYDWNKYNRAHYDSENKPPKVVFGYKFNIMFPGMKQAPTYRLEPYAAGNGGDDEEPDRYCVLKFLCSEPFVDLGFKIENKDWDRGARSGFKNTFENGVLQLHFNFVRRRYRR